jgi:hypothetical protein
MPTIVTFTPLEPPQYARVEGTGRALLHQCKDANGQHHRQRLPLGSVGGIHYLDALCLYCGSHFMWVEESSERPKAGRPSHRRARE